MSNFNRSITDHFKWDVIHINLLSSPTDKICKKEKIGELWVSDRNGKKVAFKRM